MLQLRTFGGLSIEADDPAVAPRLGPPRLALLAVIAAAGDRGVSRERLLAVFWPDATDDRARHALRQALYAIRTALGRDAVGASGPRVVLDAGVLSSDVAAFLAALDAGDRERAVSLSRRPFLDGFDLPDYPDFERWVEEERHRLTGLTLAALLSLATEASRAGRHDAAVSWWGRLTERDPLSGRFALGHIRALAQQGDRAAALASARRHTAIVRRELEADPDPEVRQLEAELRTSSEALPVTVVSPPPSAEASAPAPPSVAARERVVKRPRPAWRRFAEVAATVMIVTGFLARSWTAHDPEQPTYAVGLIRDDGAPGSPGSSRVLTDMVATNLARLAGLRVLANSRLLELMRPGGDSAAGYATAARRAGATDLLEGELAVRPHGLLRLEVRRVGLETGIVKGVYQVSAADRAALVDSLTRVVALGLSQDAPAGSIAAVTTSSQAAYRLYVAGVFAFHQNDIHASQRLMHAALAEDSTFAMAWYYLDKLHWLIADSLFEGRAREPRRRALEYAARLPERDRLAVTAELLGLNNEDPALAVAESLTTRYPDDPRNLVVLGKVRMGRGDWAGAVAATERAIQLDSAVPSLDVTACRLCDDFRQLADLYLWWDSLPAVARTAHRFRVLRPGSPQPYFLLGVAGARGSDSAVAYDNFRRLAELGGATSVWTKWVQLAFEKYDELERQVGPLLESGAPDERESASWDYILALRNQGRLREAEQLNRTGSLKAAPVGPRRHAPGLHNEGILALERGRTREAAGVFARLRGGDIANDPPGIQARSRAWSGTLQGMALAAAGDTGAVRALADSVERWGAGSAYGRDRKAHHYLRGLLFVAEGRDRNAVPEFQAAIHSASQGFTRVNYELARALIRLGRPAEAIGLIQAALRGELDASCLYVTHTALHEVLAQAFVASGQPDSAAVHYRAVVKAWRRADAEFEPRRAVAHRWLVRFDYAARNRRA